MNEMDEDLKKEVENFLRAIDEYQQELDREEERRKAIEAQLAGLVSKQKTGDKETHLNLTPEEWDALIKQTMLECKEEGLLDNLLESGVIVLDKDGTPHAGPNAVCQDDDDEDDEDDSEGGAEASVAYEVRGINYSDWEPIPLRTDAKWMSVEMAIAYIEEFLTQDMTSQEEIDTYKGELQKTLRNLEPWANDGQGEGRKDFSFRFFDKIKDGRPPKDAVHIQTLTFSFFKNGNGGVNFEAYDTTDIPLVGEKIEDTEDTKEEEQDNED